ncbi:MAG: amidohydrolase [Candidatus Latescibacterota bacterium]
MKEKRNLLVVAFIMLALVLSCAGEETADLIISGGPIYTMDAKNPRVEAVAMRGDRIVYAGTSAGARAFEDEATIVLDIGGRAAYPGFVDAHAHLIGLGKSLSQLSLVGTRSSEEIRAMVIDKQSSLAGGLWIQGRGWDQNDWSEKEFPTWRDLQGTEANPICLRRVDGHAAWVNRKALELCGITRNSAEPAGGRIIRDENGDPTGVFIDDAIDLISDHIADPTLQEKITWAKLAIQECNRYGLVGVHDAGIHALDLAAYIKLHGTGELTMRIHAMVDADSAEFLMRHLRKGRSELAGGQIIVGAVKMYVDGALGSRGAALLEPYDDDPLNKGLLVTPPDSLYKLARLALEHGFQACTHAIGDAGVRATLDAYEKALRDYARGDHRFRIEHAQVVSPQDIPRFAALGVIPSMQPTHATSDMYWAQDRVGAERIRGAYAWRTFIEQGCRIPCGSDFPAEGVNPLWGIYAAVTRMDKDGWPEGGWRPDERMTMQEAIEGFTINAAFASFSEKRCGSIEAGKFADITILDKDLFDIPPREILNTRVVYTIVGGKVVYSNPASH